MMDNDKPEECNVCYNNYDEELRRPRTLPCGHTFCTQCIEDTINNVQLTCPSCRAEHSATAATQFPICYIVEALIKKLKDTHLTPVGTVSVKPGQDHTRGISKKLQSMVEEHKSSINNLVSECEEVLSQLGKYQRHVRDWKTQHHQLQDRLYDLVEQNMAAIKLLEQEDTSVVNMTTEGEAGKEQLQTMLECLNLVSSAQEVFGTIDEADQYNVEAEDWIQKCQKLFPDVNTVCTSVKVQDTIKKALDMTTKTSATAVPVLEDSGSTIMEKVERITGEISLGKLTVDDLSGMSESIKRLVDSGLVFGVQQDKDDLRYSRITLQDGQLYLHTLQHQPLPAHTHTIQVTEVMETLESSSTLVFLDLAWPGSPRRRLHIQLDTDTMMTRQFVLLCTGQQQQSGYSFLNTKLLCTGEQQQSGYSQLQSRTQHLLQQQSVSSNLQSSTQHLLQQQTGFYNFDLFGMEQRLVPEIRVVDRDLPFLNHRFNGKKKARRLPRKCDHQYHESGNAGDVGSLRDPWGNKIEQFCISITTGGYQWPRVFGKVVRGLDVVRAAVNHSNITEVTVVDRGVVFTL